MAVGSTYTVGRVALRVIPDSRGFRADLKKTAERMENTGSKVVLGAGISARELLRSIKNTVRELNADLVNGVGGAVVRIPARIIEMDAHINDDEFACAAAQKLIDLMEGKAE